MRVLLIDNLDSFTFNLVQALRVLGAEVRVLRREAYDEAEARGYAPTHLVLSPGPGHPRDAQASIRALETFLGRIPVLGVCLGHQVLGMLSGARIGPATRPVHGKATRVFHDKKTVYRDLPNPFPAGRYHSLCVEEQGLPAELAISAYSDEGEILGLRHAVPGAEGVQFHPESFLTPDGNQLLANFLELELRGVPETHGRPRSQPQILRTRS